MVGTEQEQLTLHQTLYGKGKGIMPMDVDYTKDGSLNQQTASIALKKLCESIVIDLLKWKNY